MPSYSGIVQLQQPRGWSEFTGEWQRFRLLDNVCFWLSFPQVASRVACLNLLCLYMRCNINYSTVVSWPVSVYTSCTSNLTANIGHDFFSMASLGTGLAFHK